MVGLGERVSFNIVVCMSMEVRIRTSAGNTVNSVNELCCRRYVCFLTKSGKVSPHNIKWKGVNGRQYQYKQTRLGVYVHN